MPAWKSSDSPAVQWQRIAARDATALIVALLARFAELVVELADVYITPR